MSEHLVRKKLSIAEFANSKQCCFPKNTIVVHQGESMQFMYFIKKGIVRGFYLDEDGKEVTKCFSKEQEVFGVEGFLYHRDASYSIECLEEVECIQVNYEEVHQWIQKDVMNTYAVNEMMIQALQVMEERAKALLLSDAMERYQRFLNDYGQIAERLTQKCIASYLGINEASLCRLKRRLT